MNKITRKNYNIDALMRLVRSVTFFKDLVRFDQDQFELLLSVSAFYQAESAEVVMTKGDKADTLYFLLKGQMAVYNEDGRESLSVINPGEVFGTLSMVTGSPRSATVKAEGDVILLGLDFSYFNDVNDYSLFTLSTKLIAYRMVVHNIRWMLELNKMQNPEHPLASKLSTMPIYNGAKDTKEELASLHERARLLAELLCDWNEQESKTKCEPA